MATANTLPHRLLSRSQSNHLSSWHEYTKFKTGQATTWQNQWNIAILAHGLLVLSNSDVQRAVVMSNPSLQTHQLHKKCESKIANINILGVPILLFYVETHTMIIIAIVSLLQRIHLSATFRALPVPCPIRLSLSCPPLLLIRSNGASRTITRALQPKCRFFPARWGQIRKSRKTCSALFTHELSIRATASWNLSKSNKYKAQTLVGNPTGYWRC